jgi:hypothetical protein
MTTEASMLVQAGGGFMKRCIQHLHSNAVVTTTDQKGGSYGTKSSPSLQKTDIHLLVIATETTVPESHIYIHVIESPADGLQ